ncbi:MAG: tRNA uridine-5-carboxymethylaminomethyl(34) synthesis GTPase MnmE [Geobacteraceae bacterium]|nr:tRNA uridine-5-carboxymethylaminomethyl(34) synthesis GTPase MnmE [Geobacteraceae bacterium]
MYHKDTIAAIATPVGEGGIGIVRVSGAGASGIASRIFRARGSGGLESHRFYYGEIVDPVNGIVLDEAMAVVMLAPRSYTREDVLEIQCHGGYLVVRKVLELVLCQGARLADPGEFTKRAFLNGRIDLLQAEAVIELIRSKTEAALALAQHQRDGFLSREISAAKNGIFSSLAMIEAYIDFPEDDILLPDSNDIESSVRESLARIDELLEGFSEGRVIREGVSVLIAGKPNVGKSSLLNTLLREKRAIVTSVPGTTRDIIEEVVNINGLPVTLLDTAGIRETEDEVEQEGMRLTLEKIPLADLVLVVVDGSRPFDDEDRLIMEAVAGCTVILVLNKSDLQPLVELPVDLEDMRVVRISARDADGIDELREAIFSMFVREGVLEGRDYTALTQVRHRDALEKAKLHIASFFEGFGCGAGLEFSALDLRDALSALGEVTGETTPDSILDEIFSRFCIGK